MRAFPRPDMMYDHRNDLATDSEPLVPIGRSIESTDDLFQNSIWSMWRHAYPTEDEKVRHGVQETITHKMDEEQAWESKAAEPTVIHSEERDATRG